MKSTESKRQETMREPNSMANDLYSDCLQNILSFEKPLEIWGHRLVSSTWHEAVPVALFHVHSASVTDDNDVDIHRIIVNLCPNLTSVEAYGLYDGAMEQVKYLGSKNNPLISVGEIFLKTIIFLSLI